MPESTSIEVRLCAELESNRPQYDADTPTLRFAKTVQRSVDDSKVLQMHGLIPQPVSIPVEEVMLVRPLPMNLGHNQLARRDDRDYPTFLRLRLGHLGDTDTMMEIVSRLPTGKARPHKDEQKKETNRPLDPFMRARYQLLLTHARSDIVRIHPNGTVHHMLVTEDADTVGEMLNARPTQMLAYLAANTDAPQPRTVDYEVRPLANGESPQRVWANIVSNHYIQPLSMDEARAYQRHMLRESGHTPSPAMRGRINAVMVYNRGVIGIQDEAQWFGTKIISRGRRLIHGPLEVPARPPTRRSRREHYTH